MAYNEKLFAALSFFVGFQGTNVRLPTHVSFLHKVSSLHKCPQKKAMNAKQHVIATFLSIIQLVITLIIIQSYQIGLQNQNIIIIIYKSRSGEATFTFILLFLLVFAQIFKL
jgi:hypothetical protein